MRNLSKKALAVMLAASMLLSAPMTAFAAEEENTPKQEVVYVNLNHDGSVSDIYVVNIFDLDQKGQIIDYGSYTALRDMTSTAEVGYDNGKVTIDADAGKLYYEGTLDSKVMPWKFDIHYYIDGKEYSPEEIGGKSGALKITMTVRKNDECSGSFFEDYAVQASFTLDTNQCSNIIAEGATQANVGKNKQLTYTILPGREEDILITADVQDFEMPSIAINGVSMSLNVEVDDEELMDQVYELLDGIKKLDDGAGDIKDGVDEVQDGVENDLQSGVTELNDGAGELHDGASDLRDGGVDLNDGAFDLKDGVQQLDDGLNKLDDGILQVDEALRELDSNSDTLTKGSAEVKKALHTIKAALDQVNVSADQIEALVTASNQINEGIIALQKGAQQLQAISYAGYSGALQQAGIDVSGLAQANTAQMMQLKTLIANLESTKQTLSGILAELKQQPTVPPQTDSSVPEGQQTENGQTTGDGSSTEDTNGDVQENNSGTETDTSVEGSAEGENTEDGHSESDKSDGNTTEEGNTDAGDSESNQEQQGTSNHEDEITEQGGFGYGESNQLSDLLAGPETTAPEQNEQDDTNQSGQSNEDLINQLEKQIGELDAQIASLQGLQKVLAGNVGMIAGTKIYFDKVEQSIPALIEGSNNLKENYETFNGKIGELAEMLKGMLTQMGELKSGISTLTEQYDLLDTGINQYTEGVGKILEGYGQVTDGAEQLVDGSGKLVTGSRDLYDGTVDMLEGIVEFYDATGTLRDGTGELDEGVADLLAGIITLNDGAQEMKDGTVEMRDRTDGMDTKITDQIDEMIDNITGGDHETTSFVSEKNTNVQSVQFVIKTDPIEKPEIEQPVEQQEEKLTFWQKLLRLFHIEK